MVMTEEIIAVLLGGALGSVLRFLVSRWINELLPKYFPWGVLFVNIIGCFVIGFLVGLWVDKVVLNPFWRAGIFIGLLGGFTTFSSFSIDTVILFQSGEFALALMNILFSLLGCFGATVLGLMIAKAFFG